MDLSELLAKANEDINKLKKSLSATKGWNTRYQKIIDEFKERLNQLENQYKEMLKNSDRMITEYANKNQELKSKIDDLEREIEYLRSQSRQAS